MSTPRFHATLQATLRFHAPPATLFPLLCPVRERDWLPGWEAQVLHSRSGLAELGCVFTTADPDGTKRVWVITRHEPQAGRIQFVQFISEVCVIRLDIELAGDGDGTRASWVYEVTALAGGSEAFFEAYTPEAFEARMARLEGCMNTYLEHGTLSPC